MDEIVRRAMARWPRVPAVFGWLSLDRRGRFLLRGEPVGHESLAAFIGRNYGPDDAGRWFFQNGPQRVFVALAYTPWIYRLDGAGGLRTHTDLPVVALTRAWLDDAGGLLLETGHGVGAVEDRDLSALADAMAAPGGEAAVEAVLAQPERAAGAGLALAWRGALVDVGFVPAGEAPRRFGFDPAPAEAPGEGTA
jgi:hypothetical protein